MQSPSPPLLISRANFVATVTLNRPSRLNAINDELTLCLDDVLRRLDADDMVRVIVIRGAGPGFTAGGDLQEFVAQPEQAPAMAARFQNAVRTLVSVRKPIVASLHGAVAGGGLGLALACDLAIAAENLRMVFAYSKLGVTCDGGLSYSLPRLVGMRKALEIAMIDVPIGSAEALRLGLVNWVVPTDLLETETAHTAERLAKLDQLAVGKTKLLFAEGWSRNFSDQLDAELASFADCSGRPEFVERVTALSARP